VIRRALPSFLQAEFDQFMILSRGSVRSLLNAALLARDSDPSQFAIWSLVLLSTPPAMYGFREMVRYSALSYETDAVIEQMIQVDRTFFLLYGMLVAALVAATTWEALLPDRADQEIVGSLPVRARTIAAARLGAAIWTAGVAASTISVPAAILLTVAAPSHPALGFFPFVLFAHLVSTIGGSLFFFILLLILRAAMAICFGAKTSERLATLMQLLTIAGLAEVFFFIPSVIPALIARLAAGDPAALLIPSTPFAALYAWLVGVRYPSLGLMASMAPLALLSAIGVVIPLYLWPARLFARRVLEAQPHQHAGFVSSLARGAAVALPSSPAVRSVLTFTVTTLLRSRPHRLIVTAYLGAALAVGTVSVIAGGLRGAVTFAEPVASLLALPLVLLFFLTTGLRAAFAVPSDMDANWAFRLSRPRVLSAIDATSIAVFLLATAPVCASSGLVGLLLGWSRHDVLVVVALDAMCGAVFIESALRDWKIVPFTCARSGDAEAIKSRWLGQILPLLLFAFVNAAIQKAVLASNRAVALYMTVAMIALVLLRIRLRVAAQDADLQFDASPPDAMASLNLSDAIN